MAKSSTPPAGGRTASAVREGGWGIVVVLAAHVLNALTTGILRSSGVFYLSWQNEFNTSAKDTAAVQSIMSSTFFFCGLIGGVLTKRFGCRFSGMLGGALSWLGLFGSYWVQTIGQLYVTAAIAGCGMGISLNAGIFVVALYFKEKYKLANSIAYSGVGTGIMAASPLLQLLLDSYGWRGAILITSTMTANIVVCAALFRPRAVVKVVKLAPSSSDSGASNEVETLNQNITIKSEDDFGTGEACDVTDEQEASITGNKVILNFTTEEGAGSSVLNISNKPGPIVRLFRILSFWLGLDVFAKSYRALLLGIICALLMMPYVGFLIFIIPRAQSAGVAPSSAAFLLTLFGIGSLLGRLGHGMLISWRKVAAEVVFAACLAVAGISALLALSDVYVLLAASSFVHGFTSGAYLAIQLCLTRSFVGLENFAVGIGWVRFFSGIGSLTGPIISGWLFDVTASYITVSCVLAGIYFCSTILCLLFPLLKRLEPGTEIQT